MGSLRCMATASGVQESNGEPDYTHRQCLCWVGPSQPFPEHWLTLGAVVETLVFVAASIDSLPVTLGNDTPLGSSLRTVTTPHFCTRCLVCYGQGMRVLHRGAVIACRLCGRGLLGGAGQPDCVQKGSTCALAYGAAMLYKAQRNWPSFLTTCWNGGAFPVHCWRRSGPPVDAPPADVARRRPGGQSI